MGHKTHHRVYFRKQIIGAMTCPSYCEVLPKRTKYRGKHGRESGIFTSIFN